ncbi:MULTISPECIES: PepSY domain-containing protein [unclassified Leptolyngbya]|uniref:PepSY-associated TM helix domain-containing protein n=1 Tax=unclassified Leptolyngbya TaxID=2650499 RepID=UPI001683129D|nr:MULTISPECIES: PepSY domain-containing protein [unclassified Leptolyngbya]MBD1909772.1 PepSY domain-containing protein [Leptolyngbya sp. FACHB-8]MBD2157671.1 PepSY domain-containing protein [Leptolyngbya sp. FACHB-16]
MSKSATAFNQTSTVQSPGHRFYRTVWRWHFYAGLFVIPFMLILAITGIIYLFKPQLDTAMYHNLMFVQPGANTLSYTEQVHSVQKIYPGATVTQVTPNIAVDRSSEVLVTTTDERNLMVFVDPHTGQVLGSRDEDNNLQAITRKIHGELLIGKLGDYLVELAACWGLVLLISGLYLWLPRNKFSVLGTLIPRLWSQNKRVFWRDLHAVPGFYGILLIGFLILTGLPWTGFWGETFANVYGKFPAQMWDDVPQSTVLTGSLNQRGQVVPWAVEQLPMPQSTDAGHSNHGNHGEAGSAPTQAGVIPGTTVDLNSVIALAQEKGAPPGFSVTLPEGETGVYTVSAFPGDPTQEVTMHIDQYSGKVLADVRWKDYGLLPKAVEMGAAIHMGKYFGWANQLLMLLAALIVMLLSITGAVMWWQRRPQEPGLIGAPAMPPYVQNWRVPLAIVAVLGLAFPLVGLSLVVVLLLDYFVLSRIPALKRVFN